MFITYLYCLEHLEASIYPNVDDWIDRGGRSIKGVRDHQEMVRPDREELPVVGPGGRQRLVNLKSLSKPVPFVNHAVYGVIIITWKTREGDNAAE